MKIEKFIKAMIGKTYVFKGEQYTIRNIEHAHGDKYIVHSDKLDLQVSDDQLREDFKEVKSQEKELLGVVVHREATKELQHMDSVTTILLDNIKKVQQDPSYIAQAKSVNESVKNLIATKKTQIEVIKLMKEK